MELALGGMELVYKGSSARQTELEVFVTVEVPTEVPDHGPVCLSRRWRC